MYQQNFVNEKVQLCALRAIIVGKAIADKDPNYDRIKET